MGIILIQDLSSGHQHHQQNVSHGIYFFKELQVCQCQTNKMDLGNTRLRDYNPAPPRKKQHHGRSFEHITL